MPQRQRSKLLNFFKSIPSLVVNMNIDQFSGHCIMVVMAVFVLTVTAIYVIPAAFAQNTDGNVTGRNITAQPGMSQEEVEALCSLSPACIT